MCVERIAIWPNTAVVLMRFGAGLSHGFNRLLMSRLSNVNTGFMPQAPTHECVTGHPTRTRTACNSSRVIAYLLIRNTPPVPAQVLPRRACRSDLVNVETAEETHATRYFRWQFERNLGDFYWGRERSGGCSSVDIVQWRVKRLL